MEHKHDHGGAVRRNQAIGILGGSFNPPHEGHRALVTHAMRRLGLHQFRVLVSPQNPLKDAKAYAPLDERLAATRQLLRGLPRVRVAPEAKVGPVYAVRTVMELIRREPEQAFVYVMGADSFAGLHRWRQWRAIVEGVPIAVLARPGYRLAALKSPAALRYAGARIPERRARHLQSADAPAWVFIEDLAMPQSSTAIREGAAPPQRPR